VNPGSKFRTKLSHKRRKKKNPHCDDTRTATTTSATTQKKKKNKQTTKQTRRESNVPSSYPLPFTFLPLSYNKLRIPTPNHEFFSSPDCPSLLLATITTTLPPIQATTQNLVAKLHHLFALSLSHTHTHTESARSHSATSTLEPSWMRNIHSRCKTCNHSFIQVYYLFS
jgi:hypothetical protein